ncbi:MAG: hypothetical protein HC866_17705 [Leptolyngbyaceae cyanobacterium RU_5_1]|nr:hypothetical protein [Leptolyngbyaceae cyanobacterium RU_5_1]
MRSGALLLTPHFAFTNPIPTIGILLLAVATLEADGSLMCIGYGITLVVFSIAYALWLAPGLMQNIVS